MAERSALNAVAIRSRLVLELASELAGGADRSIRLAEVHLRDLATDSTLCLSSLSTTGAVFDVVEGRLDYSLPGDAQQALF